VISTGTAASIGTLLAQTYYQQDAERGLLRAIPFLIVGLWVLVAAMLASRALLAKRKEQGFKPLRPSSGSAARRAGNGIVVSHQPGGASAVRLARSLSARDGWTVRTSSRSSDSDVIPSMETMVVIVDGSWPLSSTGRLRAPAQRHLEAARAAGVTVVPVLVDGASMPTEADLPKSFGYFARLQAHTVHDDSWDHDVDALSAKLARA